MNAKLYEKYKNMITGELDYRICDLITEELDTNDKIKFVFAAYVKVLDRVRSDYTKMDTDIDLTPEQLDDITRELGGMHMAYNSYLRGLSATDVIRNMLAGKDIPDDVEEALNELDDVDIQWPVDIDDYLSAEDLGYEE
ncbi:MAG: hypothetical protein IKS48_06155 [Eubacterium sp.]|nr:hypothetical protein [Eubacterium sp.]